MSNSSKLEDKHARNRQERLRFIKEWAQYVRTHPDDDWGEQVNELVNSQIQSARNVEHERPDMDRLREESPLLNDDSDRRGNEDRRERAEENDDEANDDRKVDQ